MIKNKYLNNGGHLQYIESSPACGELLEINDNLLLDYLQNPYLVCNVSEVQSYVCVYTHKFIYMYMRVYIHCSYTSIRVWIHTHTYYVHKYKSRDYRDAP